MGYDKMKDREKIVASIRSHRAKITAFTGLSHWKYYMILKEAKKVARRTGRNLEEVRDQFGVPSIKKRDKSIDAARKVSEEA